MWFNDFHQIYRVVEPWSMFRIGNKFNLKN